MSTQGTPPRDYQRDLTDRIVAALEAGTPPWRRPWAAGSQAPINAASGRHYSGANVLILGMDPRAWETSDPRWATFNQAKANGWSVRKGERATMIFYVGMIEDRAERNGSDADSEATRKIPFVKPFPVFHASQIEGIPAYRPPSLNEAPWRRPDGVQTILDRSHADIRIGGTRAYYAPSSDHIQLPPDDAFAGRQQWAATALHELSHWTGHPSRLRVPNRTA